MIKNGLTDRLRLCTLVEEDTGMSLSSFLNMVPPSILLANVEEQHYSRRQNARLEPTVRAISDYDTKKLELDINARQVHQSGQTALMLAVQEGNSEEIVNIVKHLLQHPDISVNLQDDDGHTALIIATIHDFAAAVEALLKKPGIHVDLVKKKTGRSTLMYAASGNSAEIAEMLLNHGALVGLKDREGNTALNLAANFGFTSVQTRRSKIGMVEYLRLQRGYTDRKE